MNRRLGSLALVAILLSAGCSDEPTLPSGSDVAPGATDSTDGPGEGKTRASGKDRRDGDRPSGAGTSKGTGSDRRATRNRERGSNGGDTRPSDGSGSSALAYPAAGTYVYAQSGYEEFCQTTSCEREDLPREQSVQTTYRKRSENAATLVSEARMSSSRLTRTTYRFTSEKALITDVYTRFEYENVRFEDSYRPDPPVEALRFPLTPGQSWSGRWKDKTSGRYEISVGPRERVRTATGTVSAFRIDTSVRFEGQFEGSSDALVWFDPDTKTIVKSEGEMDIRSAFGRYRSEFSTVLDSGPGY